MNDDEIIELQRIYKERSENFVKNLEGIIKFNDFYKEFYKENGRPLFRALMYLKKDDLWIPNPDLKGYYANIECIKDIDESLISIKNDIEYILKERNDSKVRYKELTDKLLKSDGKSSKKI